MVRVCDIDALFVPGSMVFYVVREDKTSKKFRAYVRNEDEMISAHRPVEMLIFHKNMDTELNLPIVTYCTGEEIHYEPKRYLTLTVEEFKKILEYDTDNVEINYIGNYAFVSAIKIDPRSKPGKIIVNVETASVIVQMRPPH